MGWDCLKSWKSYSFTNIDPPQQDPPQQEEVDAHFLYVDEQLSSTELSTMPTPSPIQSSLPIPSVAQPSATLKRKRSNYREKVLVNLEKRGLERDRMLKTLLEEDDEDDVELFFRSIAKSVKKMPPALQLQAKVETLNLVGNLETQMWNSTQFDSTSSE